MLEQKRCKCKSKRPSYCYLQNGWNGEDVDWIDYDCNGHSMVDQSQY